MKNMRSIFMYLDSFHFFCKNISAHMKPFVHHQYFLSSFSRLAGKYGTEQSGAYNKIVI